MHVFFELSKTLWQMQAACKAIIEHVKLVTLHGYDADMDNNLNSTRKMQV